MKRFLILLSLIFCNTVCADTINLHWLNEDGSTYENSTCVIDSDLILPATPPTKYGYTFTGWKMINPYTLIEYLKSTGTQYIDTGYISGGNLKIEIAFMNASSLWMCGVARSVGRTDGFAIGGNQIRCGTQYIENITLNQSNIKYVVKVDKYGYTINGQNNYWSNTADFSLSSPIYLFWAQGSSYSKGGTIYYAKLYDNDILVRDFIPVIDLNRVPCMYDKVTRQFFYNQGTGQFIAGPVLTE